MMKKQFTIIFFTCISFLYSHDRSPLYIATAANSSYKLHLLQLIGSIHKHNFDILKEIAVFNLGLTEQEKKYIGSIEKVRIYEVEPVHPDILKPFHTRIVWRDNHTPLMVKQVPGWYAWKFVILKQALDMFPHVLYLDAGTTICNNLKNLNSFIKKQGYFLCTIGDDYLHGQPIHSLRWGTTKQVIQEFNLAQKPHVQLLDLELVMGGIIGADRSTYPFFYQLYELSKHLDLFADDGTTPEGFGCGRHDQPLLTIRAHQQKMNIFYQDPTQLMPIELDIDGIKKYLYLTWDKQYVNKQTHIYSSRNDLENFSSFIQEIKFK